MKFRRRFSTSFRRDFYRRATTPNSGPWTTTPNSEQISKHLGRMTIQPDAGSILISDSRVQPQQ
ncbi:hypothetical protein BOX15_Mlig012446g1 [Macrostomum lignano]|uniref:Uncharacterized protein n=1 Tax=Macrostomum lignano TaxID=282301 RepID=A0A267EXR1_9PLAT|nr:hypothetical protein BOX15_Mlig012446g1 [Macrostomum lignano]